MIVTILSVPVVVLVNALVPKVLVRVTVDRVEATSYMTVMTLSVPVVVLVKPERPEVVVMVLVVDDVVPI